VYGQPKPPSSLNLNYKGYAKPDILSQYQLGLITITKDQLRREGTSAKHVEYLSYGLPVLVPEWRTSVKGMGGSIFYTEENFLSVIAKLTKKSNWNIASQQALREAKQYDWEKVFTVIDTIAGEV
jgi:carbamoylphosphate synthase large subunit